MFAGNPLNATGPRTLCNAIRTLHTLNSDNLAFTKIQLFASISKSKNKCKKINNCISLERTQVSSKVLENF